MPTAIVVSDTPSVLPASLTAALTALLIGALIWRHGVSMTPDSWAYWQGSVSLLHGDGYRFFFGGLPITDWPPGYSVYLAMWERLFGVSGRTLAAANVFLGGLAAFSWSWVLLRLLGRAMGNGRDIHFPVAAVIACYITLVTAYACTCVLADNLKYALLPWLLYASTEAAEAATGPASLRRTVAAGLIGAVLMLVHNGSAALVTAACAVVLCGRARVGQKIGAAAVLGGLALGPWLVVTRVLGQTGSHRIGLEIADRTPLYYLNELARGIGDLIAARPTLGCVLFLVPVGLIAWGLAGGRATATAPTGQGRRVVALCALFAAVSVATLYVMFNLTRIQDPIDALNGRRYLLFLPLIAVPLGLACGARRLPPAVSLALVAVAVSLPLLRVVGDISPNFPLLRSPLLASAIRAGHTPLPDRLGLDATLRPDYVNRPPARESGELLVAPPMYPWISRQLAARRKP